MQHVVLGRTGLTVSVAGLGCGGHSRLGQSQGRSFEESVAVVKAAIDAGVTFIDTAAAYGTEDIVGAATCSQRESVVISSKQGIVRPGTSPLGQEFVTGPEFLRAAEQTLKRLSTDYIDVYHLHGVMPDQYDYCRSALLPALVKLKDQGKILFLGLTERFIYDTDHKMLQLALEDDYWDVVMSGFNMINPSARHTVFKQTRKKGIGTLNMFAVRRALSNPILATEALMGLAAHGVIDKKLVNEHDPLGFVLEGEEAETLAEAAYRFCAHEPGVDVVLTGTGSISHLSENLRSINKKALSGTILRQLKKAFGDVDSISGN
ncbi:MAG: aldo/keto reductase [Roseibium sp.]